MSIPWPGTSLGDDRNGRVKKKEPPPTKDWKEHSTVTNFWKKWMGEVRTQNTEKEKRE